MRLAADAILLFNGHPRWRTRFFFRVLQFRPVVPGRRPDRDLAKLSGDDEKSGAYGVSPRRYVFAFRVRTASAKSAARRYWVLFLLSFISAQQSAVWLTYSPVETEVGREKRVPIAPLQPQRARVPIAR
jgi:hypothetical protein